MDTFYKIASIAANVFMMPLYIALIGAACKAIWLSFLYGWELMT